MHPEGPGSHNEQGREGMARQMKTQPPAPGTSMEVTPISYETVITELRLLPTSDRLIGLYELGLDGCANEDIDQITAVLQELTAALDFGQTDIAEGFFRLYTYCLEQARDGHFDKVGFVLQDLRDTLAEAASEVDRTTKTPLPKTAGA
jgi:hypothetical protein